MKKLIFTIAMLLCSNFAMAKMGGENSFILDFVSLLFLVLFIVLVVRFFRMSNDIKALREFLTPEHTYFETIEWQIRDGKVSDARESLMLIINRHPDGTPTYRKAKGLLDQINNQERHA